LPSIGELKVGGRTSFRDVTHYLYARTVPKVPPAPEAELPKPNFNGGPGGKRRSDYLWLTRIQD
jgi:hypothetical protein